MFKNHIVILNRNEEENQEMQAYFEESGYDVSSCLDEETGLELLGREKENLDILIYDVDMLSRTEYENLEKIRQISDLILIVVTKDARLDSQLYAYSKKIDDYIVKPVPLPLLEAHVESFLRRVDGEDYHLETVGELTIDYESRKIILGGKLLRVTAKEFDLMEYFIRHRGMVLSRDKILDAVWGFDYIGGYRSVDTLVKKLRAKMTDQYPYIRTIYGVGYTFDVMDG